MEKEGRNWLSFFGFILFLYCFVLSIVLIRVSFSEIVSGIFRITKDNFSILNGVGFGWLLTLATQASGAATSVLIAMNSAGIIGSVILIYMVVGTRIGTSITMLFVSLFVSAKRRDFRHGFEIGLANLVYAFPIVVIMFLLEYFFSFFRRTGNYFVALGVPFKLDFLNKITLPVVNALGFAPKFVLAALGFALLIISLKEMSRFMLSFWGEDFLKIRIRKYMKKKSHSFFLGLGITAILLSSSITITLLIPFIVIRFLNLKEAIPYIIGANLGGILDAVLGGLVLGKMALPAIFTYVSFSLIGLFWLFNTELLFKITKHISKKTLHVSRLRAVLFVLLFIVLAFMLAFI